MTTIERKPIEGTETYPYVATIVMDPATWSRFQRTLEDRPEVRIRKVDDQTPDAWTVYVACASERVRDLLESGW